ncbi:cytochrome P450 [Dactylosporangium sp. AC04546]|uniref:cytochrome P450 n=1 Tax=Dactylosporangium sp. AC04546 TaxID=2862460 RepID=UPI001EDD1938|nr:cytochrome P450 [Dactylosporangium sp. AC04546]WVK80753.1 cytochrome P450 [Dactylosporangium sp. AC04546]
MTDLALDDLRARYRRDYDPYANRSIDEQLAELADRRTDKPVSYSARGNGCWVLTDYDDVSNLLRRNNRGVVSFPNEPDGLNLSGARKAQIPIELDGPEHRQVRQVLDPQFAPKKVAELEDHLREQCNRLIDAFIEDGKVDFVKMFAVPFPGATVLAIMGWPGEDLEMMNGWADVLLHGVPGGTEEENNAARGRTHQEFAAYMAEKIPQWRAAPRNDDVMSVMLDAEIGGQKLTDDQLFDFSVLMMMAGLDTVQSVLARCARYFAQRPDQWDRMFEDAEQVPAAVEELLRWATPPVPTRTITDEHLEIRGVRIPKGERVHAPLGSANRDPKYYPDPDAVIFDRPAKPHLAFGVGTHRCVGLHLARLELRIAFEELHRRIPRFELDPDAPAPHEHLGLAWGVNDVHLRFAPGPRELS